MKTSITTKEMIAHNVSRILLTTALFLTPLTTFAYTQSLSDLSILAVKYFNQAIYVIVALAVLVFVWNIYRYFFKADPENKKEAGLYVMYSVIGFFVIIAFWGLVNIVSNTLNLNNNIPSLNFFNSSVGGSSGSNPGGSNSTFNPGGSNSNPGGSNSGTQQLGPGTPTDLPATGGPNEDNLNPSTVQS
jgi:uncharacterized membrane protein YgcG